MSEPRQNGELNGSAPKRARVAVRGAETADVEAQLIEQRAAMNAGDGDAVTLAAALAKKDMGGSLPTLLEVGITSARAPALKGWIFKHLDAELTTFEVCKTPFDELLALIVAGRERDVGIKIPEIASR